MVQTYIKLNEGGDRKKSHKKVIKWNGRKFPLGAEVYIQVLNFTSQAVWPRSCLLITLDFSYSSFNIRKLCL